MFTTYAALRDLFIEAARANGATLRFGTPVTAVDAAATTLTLASGEVFEADIVLGADGARGTTRSSLFDGAERPNPARLVSFWCASGPMGYC
jgi:2-polyprenyl-6-methoxyphenol hydroxylase-like FAD-dependent oxidoreductase